jgi:hypothetical protein
MMVSGAPVVMETDPRFAPFNSITDDAGQQLLGRGGLNRIPPGVLVSAEGVYKEAPDGEPRMFARIVEAAFIAHLGGDTDVVQIQRAQCKTRKLEMRARGIGTVPGALITLYEHIGDVHGIVVGTAVVDNLNEWEFRGTIASDHCPEVIMLIPMGVVIPENL